MKIDIIQFDDEVVAGTYGHWLNEWGIGTRTVAPDGHAVDEFTGADGLLLLGGHMGVHQRQQHQLLNAYHRRLPQLVERGTPILAICLGAQLLADALGGKALKKQRGERSIRKIQLTRIGEQDPLFAGLSNPFISFQWHNDCFDLPEPATHLAFTDACPGQAFRYRNAYGLQFHPEVDENIITAWCQRAKVDRTAVADYQAVQEEYSLASQRILRNFLGRVQERSGGTRE